MPVSTVTYTANGSTNQFSITFPYIDTAHVLVSVNDASASFTFHNSTTVQLSSTPTSGQTVVVYRQTPSSALVDFTDGSTLFESDLDLANTQARYLSEEARDRADSAITTVTANKANIDTVAGIAGNVTTVAGANANIATVAGANSNITTVVGNLTNIDTVAGINSNISSVAGNASNITAVANDATDIGVVAGKATEISALGTSANITNMATLGATGVVGDIATVAGVASTMSAAATNASNAASSATAAANSAAAAAASFDTFDDRYLGSKSSEPSVDNDGNALVSGSLFFDSAVGSMKVYDGGNWILATSAGAVSLLDYEYTATTGQTTFSGSDNNSATLSYSAGNLIVTLNGIVLDNGSDYTATSGTSIVLASGAAAGDHLAVVAFKSFTVADTVAASTGGTFAGSVNVSGKLGVGTTSPSRPFEVFSTQQVMQRLNSGTNSKALLSFEDTNTTGENYVSIGSEGNDMLFRTGGGNRVKIGAAGQLGVGGANYGTAGQILTSGGAGASPSWADLNAGFLANVVNVTSDTTATASQSGTLFVIKSATAILTLPAPAVGLYFGIVNETSTPTLIRVGGSNSVFANNIIFPLNHDRSVGVGTFVGTSNTKYACDFDPVSAAVISFFRNGDPNATNYSETWNIGTNTTAIYIAMHSGTNGNYYTNTSSIYLNAGAGGASFSEKLITSSIPTTLTIAGDYRQFNSTAHITNPPTSSRLTCIGTGVNMYVQRGTGKYYNQGHTQNLTGGTASGGDFNASGGSGSGSSGTNYGSANAVYGGGGGAGSPAGDGGNASTSGTTQGIYDQDGTVWSGYSSVTQMKHGGGTGGNHGTTSGGGAAGTKDSNSITMTPYIGKEFHLAGAGSTLIDQTAAPSSNVRYYHNEGAKFGHAMNDLEHISNTKLFYAPPFAPHGKGFGSESPKKAGCTIIEFKG